MSNNATMTRPEITVTVDNWESFLDDRALIVDTHYVAHANSACTQTGPAFVNDYLDADTPKPWPCASCIPDTHTYRGQARIEQGRDLPNGDGSGNSTPPAPAGPSEKQIKFLTALLRGQMVAAGDYARCAAAADADHAGPEQIIGNTMEASLTRAQVSKAIDRLLADDVKPVWDPVVPGKPGCSDKQSAFISRLADERNVDVDDGWLATKAAASAAIDRLMAMPKATKTDTVAPASSDGWEPVKGEVHMIDGDYARIHESQGTGRFYAARFNGTKFEYERGLIAKLNADTKLSAEQAAEFGRLHHMCCFCSRALDTPESTEAGYGPRCAVRHNLPWG